jgi:PKD repeat protein
VNLTVNNPYCRNMTPLIPSRYISIDDAPVANFEANITVGMVPLTVKFTNTSVGWQTDWNWTFGDGGTDTSANPVHTYSTKGIYSVSLDTTNDFGNNTLQKNSYIHALGGASATQNTAIAGITTMTVAGQLQLNFDTATLDYLFIPTNNTVLICVPPASSGFQQITFYSLDGTGFSWTGTTIRGTLSRTSLMSSVVQPSGFPAALGIPISVNYTIDYPGYPQGASVTMNVYDDTEPDYSDFLNTVKGAHFTSILGLPYIVQFQTTNIGTGYQATLNMSVDSTWVTGHGGTGQMYAIRLDYPYGEVLPISLISQDGTNTHYGTVSPNGLSKFTLSGLSGSGNVFQMVYLGVVQHFVEIQSSSDTSDGSVAGTAKGTGEGLTSLESLSLASAPEPPAAPEAKSVDLFINEQAAITQTTILQSPDQLATLSIGQGVVAKDSAENPLSSVTIASASMSDSGIPESLQGSTFSFAGIAYNLQPDGATFSPAVTITFTVPQAQWSQNFMVKEYDPIAEVWVDLPTTYHPESGTISASVSHFCIIALFSDTIKPSPAPRRTMVQTPLPTIAPPSPTSPFGVFYGIVAWLADLFMKNMYLFLIVAAIIVAFYANRRRKGRDPLRFK